MSWISPLTQKRDYERNRVRAKKTIQRREQRRRKKEQSCNSTN